MRMGWSRAARVMFLFGSLALTVRGARGEEPAESPPRLLVVWHDAHHLYPGTHRGVAREVASLFAPLDVEMHWQGAKQYDPALDVRTILVRVVLLPSDPSGPGWELEEDVMGAVLPSNGRKRSIYIFYKTVVRGLKIKAHDGRLPDLNERDLLERALGRVVAHEMIHAVAPSVRHAQHGLMRRGVTRSFLARNELVLAGSLKSAFEAGVVAILSSTSSPVASGAAGPQAVRHAFGNASETDGT